jgi:hypothetical protein
MADAKISFRIDAEKKSLWVQEAKEFGFTLTDYLIYLLDFKNQEYPKGEIHTIADKRHTDTPKIIQDLEVVSKEQFEKELSVAYSKGYQHGIKEFIKTKH